LNRHAKVFQFFLYSSLRHVTVTQVPFSTSSPAQSYWTYSKSSYYVKYRGVGCLYMTSQTFIYSYVVSIMKIVAEMSSIPMSMSLMLLYLLYYYSESFLQVVIFSHGERYSSLQPRTQSFDFPCLDRSHSSSSS
jgi:hypothetical protein